jgi:hypothetical protein
MDAYIICTYILVNTKTLTVFLVSSYTLKSPLFLSVQCANVKNIYMEQHSGSLSELLPQPSAEMLD